MEFRIEKGLLAKTINFLYDMPLKGKQSRHRSKMVKLLKKDFEEFAEEEKTLLEEHAERDENDNPKTSEDGTGYVITDHGEFVKEKIELFGEQVVIDGGEHEEMLKTVYRILDEYEGDLNGADAELYDILITALEEPV